MPSSLPSTTNLGRTSLSTSSHREPDDLYQRLLSIIQQQAQTAQQEKQQIAELTSILVDLLSSRKSKMEKSNGGHETWTDNNDDDAVHKDCPDAEILANALLKKSPMGDSDAGVPLYYKNGSEEKIAGYVPLEILKQLGRCRDCALSQTESEQQVDIVSDPNDIKDSIKVEKTDKEERSNSGEDVGVIGCVGLGSHDYSASVSHGLDITYEMPETESFTSFENRQVDLLTGSNSEDLPFPATAGFRKHSASRFDDIVPRDYPEITSHFVNKNECPTEKTGVMTANPPELHTPPDIVEFPLASENYVPDRKCLDENPDEESVKLDNNEASSFTGEGTGQLENDSPHPDEAVLRSAELFSGTLPDEEVQRKCGPADDLKNELVDSNDDACSSDSTTASSSLSMQVEQSAKSLDSVRNDVSVLEESDLPPPPPWDVVVPVIPLPFQNEDAVVPETFYPCRYDVDSASVIETRTPFEKNDILNEVNDGKVGPEETGATASSIEDSPSAEACASSGTSRVPSSQSSPVSPVSNRSSLFTPRSLLVKPVTPVVKRESISQRASKKPLEPVSSSDSGFSDERSVQTLRTELSGLDNSTVYAETLLRKAGSGEMLIFYVTDIEKTFPACSLWILDHPLSRQPKEVTRLNKKLTDFYSCRPWLSKIAKSHLHKHTDRPLFVGQAVAVRRTVNEWVRGRIMTVSEDFARVTFIDLGGCINVKIEETRPLHEQFFHPSALALRAEIAGLDPAQYDQDTAGRLITMLKERTVQGTIVCSSPTPVVRLFDFTSYQIPVEVTTLLFQDLLVRPLEKSSLQMRREVRLGVVVSVPSCSSSNHLILVDLEHLAQLENIQRAVENCSRAKKPIDRRYLDTIVAVERHGVMFRAFILSVTKDHRVFVELFDYGHRFYTKVNNLYRIPDHLIDMPPVTLGCHVDGADEHAAQSVLQDRLKELLHKVVLYEILLTRGHQQVVIRLWDDRMELVDNRLPEDNNFYGNLRVDKVFYPIPYHEHQILRVKIACVYDAYSGLAITGAIVENTAALFDDSAADSKLPQDTNHNEPVESADFMVDMQIELPKMPQFSLSFEENTFVCAFLEERNMWYRAIVYEMKDVVNNPVLYLIDIGQWESVPVRNVRPMRPEWIKEPWHSSLLHIHEFVISSFVDGHWSVREKLSLEQVEESEYRFIVTKLDAHILHGILVAEESNGHSLVS